MSSFCAETKKSESEERERERERERGLCVVCAHKRTAMAALSPWKIRKRHVADAQQQRREDERKRGGGKK
jgi:hypothetical protein